jgi:hypothetical protein
MPRPVVIHGQNESIEKLTQPLRHAIGRFVPVQGEKIAIQALAAGSLIRPAPEMRPDGYLPQIRLPALVHPPSLGLKRSWQAFSPQEIRAAKL